MAPRVSGSDAVTCGLCALWRPERQVAGEGGEWGWGKLWKKKGDERNASPNALPYEVACL